MASLKRLLWFSSILATAVVAHSLSGVYGQTPDAKPKATSSITGRVMIGENPRREFGRRESHQYPGRRRPGHV